MLGKKKILIVVQNDLTGGAEQLLKLVANEYSAQMNNVTVIIMRAPVGKLWEDIDDRIHLKYLNTKTNFPGIIRLALFLLYFSRQNEFDYTISSNININAILGFIKKIRLYKTKKLITRETTSVYLRFKGLKKVTHVIKYLFGYSASDLIVCQTDLMKQQFLENLRISRKWNLHTIQNPIDIKNILNLSNEEQSETPRLRQYIVSAGRFIHEKGFDILIHSFYLISKQKPELDLVILGEGKLRPEYHQLIADLDLEDKVILPGFKKNPMPWFKNATLCVVSSRNEGFPNVLLQMAALNNKVVSTLCAGNVDSIPSIYVCPTNNIPLLAQAMSEALTGEPDQEKVNSKFLFLKSISVSNYINTIESVLYAK
jgi:glycosyltransferase involved in cell wall biosynthesis